MLFVKKCSRLLALILLLVFIFHFDTIAQCPMCRIGAESNLKNGGTAGKGLNTGILYMLALPYLLFFTLGYIWYKKRGSTKIN